MPQRLSMLQRLRRVTFRQLALQRLVESQATLKRWEFTGSLPLRLYRRGTTLAWHSGRFDRARKLTGTVIDLQVDVSPERTCHELCF
jgi:hypothetical protein